MNSHNSERLNVEISRMTVCHQAWHYWLINIIIHSKYFPNSDWDRRKPGDEVELFWL